MIAIGLGRADCALAIAEAGGDVMVKDLEGETPLHIAARNGSVDVVQQLLNHGADSDVENIDRVVPAVYCQLEWALNRDAYTDLPLERKEAVVDMLNEASLRNALWRGRREIVMLEARHRKGKDISGGAPLDGSACTKLRSLVMWLVKRQEHEEELLFRRVVHFLGDAFTPCPKVCKAG
ncbi:unnamed protein product [Chrysoparadoxa australica]